MAATTTTTKSKWMATISEVALLKRAMKRWKSINIKRKALLISSNHSPYASNGSTCRIPSGFLAVYVGEERIRFLIPTRFLRLAIFKALLEKSGEEYGFKFSGGIVLPCEVDLFKQLLKFLDKDEKKYGRLEVNELLKLISEVGYDSYPSCKQFRSSSDHHAFRTPLLKARA
ncbi:unnamed protein product [Dovyalis caffra]|uniref:Small auxin up regulated protein n=1 Tax=Dovyalis caffra TaxID=77055 RepID=A0AAV1QST5_9ROSI|nr:unnamed protein product [Dovyalis caffra]